MEDNVAFYTHGTSSYIYFGPLSILYLSAIVFMWMKFQEVNYWIKATAFVILFLRIVNFALYKFVENLIAIVLCTTVVFIVFILFLLFSICPWRDMYIKAKSVVSEELSMANKPVAPTEVSLEISATVPSFTNPPSMPQPRPLSNPDLLAKIAEAFCARLRRYILWQYAEFGIWSAVLFGLACILISTNEYVQIPAFYIYGAWVSLGYIVLAFRVTYFYGTLLGSFSSEMRIPLSRIGILLIIQAVLLIIPMLSSHLYGSLSTLLMVCYYIGEILTIFAGCSGFVKGMNFRDKLFNPEQPHPTAI